MKNFQELKVDASILRAVEEMGFEEMTPIQEQAIPVALEGRDLIGQAQTGTGKTAAFTIPFLGQITDSEDVQVLVLTPTRELAIQVAEEVGRIGKHMGIKALPIYGGQEITRQIRALKGRPPVLIATPGRLMDHMRRRTIRLDALKVIVLDEADEMLNMGFLEDIEEILIACPEDRQTMMFSATMKKEIRTIANKFMQEPEFIRVQAQHLTVPSIAQEYYEVPEGKKLDVLCRLLDIQSPDLALVFGRTKRRVSELSDALQQRGYLAEGIHGDLSQAQREKALERFRKGSIDILVATDVAARGLDIQGVTHVYNFDIPQDVDWYVHRIGRTGRAGQEGLASTFVTPREYGQLRIIENTVKRKLKKRPLPTIAEVRQEKEKLLIGKIAELIENEAVSEYRYLAEQLLGEYDYLDIVSAALTLVAGSEDEKRNTEITLTEEKPVIRGSRGQGGQGGRRTNYGGQGYRRSDRGYKDKKQRDGQRPKKKYGGEQIKTYPRRGERD